MHESIRYAHFTDDCQQPHNDLKRKNLIFHENIDFQ